MADQGVESEIEYERQRIEVARSSRESTLLRSSAHALISRQELFASAEAGRGGLSWRVGAVADDSNNIFLALLTAMSLPLVRIIIASTFHTISAYSRTIAHSLRNADVV